MYFETLRLGCMYVYNCYLLWRYVPLYHYSIFLSLVIFLVLNSIVFDISIATPILLWLLFGMYIFIRPFTFNLLVFWSKCISCRRHSLNLAFSSCILIGWLAKIHLIEFSVCLNFWLQLCYLVFLYFSCLFSSSFPFYSRYFVLTIFLVPIFLSLVIF